MNRRRFRAGILTSVVGGILVVTSALTQEVAFASSGGRPPGNGNFASNKDARRAAKNAYANARNARIRQELEEYSAEVLTPGGRMEGIENRTNRLQESLSSMPNQNLVPEHEINSLRVVPEALRANPDPAGGIGFLSGSDSAGNERSFVIHQFGGKLVVASTTNPREQFSPMNQTTGEFTSLDGTFSANTLTGLKFGQFGQF
jgi:hypothetical protein